jgi:sugar lactone lactonase YvrE
MKRLLGSAVVLVAAATVTAHPGVGIVQDSRGNVFFTDLKQVWKVTPDGRKSVAVPAVHSHELCLDADDNLYGEHTWYEGDATKKWGHRVWCLKRDGKLTDVLPAREGLVREYGFVLDRAGNTYWPDPPRGQETVIRKRSLEGKISAHTAAVFVDVNWMTATPDGTLYLIDAGNLRRVSPDGKVTTVAARLSAQDPPPTAVSDRHYHMGLWTDAKGSVHVAVAQERLVLQVQADGRTKVVARSSEPWSPSGGLFDRDGNLWLLEYDTAHAVRLEWAVKPEAKDFIGKEALAAKPADRPVRVGLKLADKRIARENFPVLSDGRPVGLVTSGTFGPTLQASIAMALVEPSVKAEGTALEVEVRGSRVPATVVAIPFYSRRKTS